MNMVQIDKKHQQMVDDDREGFNVVLFCSICGEKIKLAMYESLGDFGEKTGLYGVVYYHRSDETVPFVRIEVSMPTVPKWEEAHNMKQYRKTESERKDDKDR